MVSMKPRLEAVIWHLRAILKDRNSVLLSDDVSCGAGFASHLCILFSGALKQVCHSCSKNGLIPRKHSLRSIALANLLQPVRLLMAIGLIFPSPLSI